MMSTRKRKKKLTNPTRLKLRRDIIGVAALDASELNAEAALIEH